MNAKKDITKRALQKRKPEHKVDDIFVQRWSPRAMSGEKIEDKELMKLFEAARWAPSSYNRQPWRFIYAKRDTEHWDTLFNLLGDFNKSWCNNAAVLAVVASKKIFDGKEVPTHSFDTGSSWQNIALQGSMMDLVVHGMAGFDYDKAKTELNIPEDYEVEAMFAAGRPGKVDSLPEKLMKNEVPSSRKPVDEFIFEGQFRGD